MSIKYRQKGISLIELIMFIVIVSVGIAGILSVMNITTKNSAAPLLRKQALAIAESLLEEIELQPFTYCDPDDPAAATATSATVGAGACTVKVENIGPEAAFSPDQLSAETRYSASTPFDNVNDYHGFKMNAGNGGIKNINNINIPSPADPAIDALSGYSVAVVVTPQDIPAVGASLAIPAAAALLIAVTVTGPDNVPITLEGYRFRYAPKS